MEKNGTVHLKRGDLIVHVDLGHAACTLSFSRWALQEKGSTNIIHLRSDSEQKLQDILHSHSEQIKSATVILVAHPDFDSYLTTFKRHTEIITTCVKHIIGDSDHPIIRVVVEPIEKTPKEPPQKWTRSSAEAFLECAPKNIGSSSRKKDDLCDIKMPGEDMISQLI